MNVTLIPHPLIKMLTPMFAKHLVVWLLLEKKTFYLNKKMLVLQKLHRHVWGLYLFQDIG